MKKIMFNDEFLLTRAVLEGRKVQTRRILKPQPHYSDRGGIVWKGGAYGLDLFGSKQGTYANFISGIRYSKDRNIPFHVGDVVAVAQSYKDAGYTEYDVPGSKGTYINFPTITFGDTAGWKNKMFVKAEFMPHQIKIIRMELQRLQDITDAEALREGIEGRIQETEGKVIMRGYIPHSNVNKNGGYCAALECPRDAYAALIDMICGKGTWDSNPWVFVYTFELIKKDKK